ncbi:M48 family metallopeptidase [Pseudidiomarina insulisalsae]|uniref:YgjP-like metallopeptidase domain-containing protein n=1 Tax=Pseudidiomarina insulisalsae TaxID=575789 RepID=A0A432YQB5_9GAMM|nr:SprT family zinc-dependent metalloprotease [Pseudidiomarina insulisalsae]RUO63538.1 hypothetical protein CWI71_00290 [Pseudidiomarina insulisalsae]
MTAIYPIQRSRRRRSLAIKIRAGEVIIQAPQHLSEARIAAFVQSKHGWIDKHLRAQRDCLAELDQRLWRDGERLRWLGEPLQLQLQQAPRKRCWRDGAQLFATVTPRANPAHEPKGVIRNWYQQQALQWLNAFMQEWATVHPEWMPRSWQMANFSSKWGHCSRQGELKFSWKLWLAPEWVVRNVVIHELCHLREFNHSSAFWRLVAQHSDDYQQAGQWLRQHGMTVLNEAYLDYHETA